jgi:catechol 2,3-dioxygenase-like lactoylglutathione lyase family enzyme
MPLKTIDHVTINCADLAKSRAFYIDVLGLADGDRPNFSFPGAWLYAGEHAVVHLVGSRGDVPGPTGNFDHVAFDASDLAAMRTRFAEAGVAFREAKVPGRPLHQVFLHDPDGVKIELNFRHEG